MENCDRENQAVIQLQYMHANNINIAHNVIYVSENCPSAKSVLEDANNVH